MAGYKTRKFWIGTPPWIIIGSVIILVPIFIFWTFDTLKRHKEVTTVLLVEKGDALIRSFEAGARTGMMAMMGGGFQLQNLLMETAQQPDILYIMVIDDNGIISAHSDPARVGKSNKDYLRDSGIEHSPGLKWRVISEQGGPKILEVYKRFSPINSDPRIRRRGMMSDMRIRRGTIPEGVEGGREQFIFIGLDMTPFETARNEETRHILIMAIILLLVGFGGIFSLFLVQAYRTTRSSLSRIKAFSDSVVSNMPIGLLALDTARRVVSFNKAAESIFRVPLIERIGSPVDNILPGQMKKELDEVDSSGKTIVTEEDFILPDGRYVPLDVSVTPLYGDGNDFLGYIMLCRDLTELQSLKEEIERSRRLASIGRLAAGVAHEIRNPLSSIKGFATYFRERYSDIQDDKKTAEIMIQEVERLDRVISQLLEFAKPVTVQKKSTDIFGLIRHSIKMVEMDAEKRNINIDLKSIPDLGNVFIDEDRIKQVLLNLYLNSIESMNEGGTLTVKIDRDKEAGQLLIEVTDTGIGIDKKDLINIFDPYFTTKQSGTGLGLAIVHKIIESHKGEIRVESELGIGTKVSINLPVE